MEGEVRKYIVRFCDKDTPVDGIEFPNVPTSVKLETYGFYWDEGELWAGGRDYYVRVPDVSVIIVDPAWAEGAEIHKIKVLVQASASYLRWQDDGGA